MVNQREIRQAVNEIAGKFFPLRIILFGSYAYGQPTEDSDVDLLILVEGRRVHDRGVKIRSAVDFPFAVDLLVRSCEEFERRIAWGDSFLMEIRDRGRVLYEAHRFQRLRGRGT